jgi:hypothetical protein
MNGVKVSSGSGGLVTSHQQLRQRLQQGPMFQRWHWLRWNFEQATETPFARLTLDALLRCDARMPGYADAMLTTLESISGREKNLDDYERIKQWLGELVVVLHFVDWDWPLPVTFRREPAAPGSQRNPEMVVSSDCRSAHLRGDISAITDQDQPSASRNA